MKGPVLMNLTPREAFVVAALRHLGEVVLWNGLDCSELVAIGEISALGVDRRGTHTAAIYAAKNPEVVIGPQLGDLAFWGVEGHATHVAIVSYGSQILSADGASSKVIDIEEARRLPYARVKLHPNIAWYQSAPFMGFRRHHELDQAPKET